jgi:hypothetical protein
LGRRQMCKREQPIAGFVEAVGDRAMLEPPLADESLALTAPACLVTRRPKNQRGARIDWITVGAKKPRIGEGVRARRAVLEPAHGQGRAFKIHLLPAQVDQLRRPEAMPVGQKDHQRITIAAFFSRRGVTVRFSVVGATGREFAFPEVHAGLALLTVHRSGEFWTVPRFRGLAGSVSR